MEKVLVCLLASTRGHQLTFPSFKRQVLDELNGDLALALLIDEKYDYSNPLWQHAKYRWTAPDFSDYGDAFDFAQRWLCQQHAVPAADWRSMLRIKGIWQGGIRSPDPQPSRSAVLHFSRWLLLHSLQQDEILDRYDRFVITRSDLVWSCPHPPLSVLDRDAIWLPDGENYGGLNDRHLVVSRADVVNCLNVIEDIVLDPCRLYEEMKHHAGWNNEQLLAHHLGRKGLLHKVKRFPYVMYSARSVHDESPTWSRGRYEGSVGHYVKYPREFEAASSYATVIRSRADWESRGWLSFTPTRAASRTGSPLLRLRYRCERAYYRIVSSLRRPRRVERLAGSCKRALRRTIGRLTRDRA
ncbi:MAG TPA: hypothetical protein VMH26_09585 [Burkholderiales bacterium]|nr:hypothetical protein [Burkholderiales bacterium]